jgi:hypothetical protein
VTIASAGWAATPKRANTSAASSLICGNVSPCLSMNSWNSPSEPVQATPTNWAFPAHFCAAASTEGASRLHVVQ